MQSYKIVRKLQNIFPFIFRQLRNFFKSYESVRVLKSYIFVRIKLYKCPRLHARAKLYKCPCSLRKAMNLSVFHEESCESVREKAMNLSGLQALLLFIRPKIPVNLSGKICLSVRENPMNLSVKSCINVRKRLPYPLCSRELRNLLFLFPYSIMELFIFKIFFYG